MEISLVVRNVLNQLTLFPLNSRISISGGQVDAPVSQKAGQVPGLFGALNSPLISYSGYWSFINIYIFE